MVGRAGIWSGRGGGEMAEEEGRALCACIRRCWWKTQGCVGGGAMDLRALAKAVAVTRASSRRQLAGRGSQSPPVVAVAGTAGR